jgi:GNAT superfamily N-acetyltransferase
MGSPYGAAGGGGCHDDTVPTSPIVLRSTDPRVPTLLAEGWSVSARSWAAEIDLRATDHAALRAAVGRVVHPLTVRELGPEDVDAVLALDRTTSGDYPGDVATAHSPLTAATASPSPRRRAFGARHPDGALVAMTYVEVDRARAEVDVTVVAPAWRGVGLATGVKAASLLALAADGVTAVRTGGSEDNAAILAANRTLGFVVDERWVTLRR